MGMSAKMPGTTLIVVIGLELRARQAQRHAPLEAGEVGGIFREGQPVTLHERPWRRFHLVEVGTHLGVFGHRVAQQQGVQGRDVALLLIVGHRIDPVVIPCLEIVDGFERCFVVVIDVEDDAVLIDPHATQEESFRFACIFKRLAGI